MAIKKYYIFFSLLISFFVYSQKDNHFKFKTISFIQKDSITNLEEFKKGEKEAIDKLENKMNPFVDGLVESLGGTISKKDIEQNKQYSDSLVNSLSQKELDKYSKVFHYQYIDKAIWKRWETKKDDEILTYPVFTDFTKGKEYYKYPYDGIEEYPYIFEKIKDLKIQEFRKEKKKIQGIECFKIRCLYSQITEYEKFDEVSSFPDEIDHIESEIWVTENIKSTYHPAFKVKEILEKYYPLEIIEKNSEAPGRIRKTILKEIF